MSSLFRLSTQVFALVLFCFAASASAALTIIGFSPMVAPVGSSVVISGIDFTGGGIDYVSTVKFNGVSASFIQISDSEIDAIVPDGATSGLITLQNSFETRSSTDSFTVARIADFFPISGPEGTSVTINGSGFTGATDLSIGGAVASFSIVDDGTITATVPVGAVSGGIKIVIPTGVIYSSGTFSVLPLISSFTPTSGLVGAAVTITGSSFAGATGVTFNGAAATVGIDSNTQISTSVPAGATTGPIAVTTAGGTATSSTNFTVLFVPTITSFTPASGPPGTSVAISGTHFTGASAVRFHGLAASTYTVNSDASIAATVPAGATSGTISVTTPGGTATSSSSFTVPPPTITGFTPTSGGAGTSVVITGTGFLGASAVAFNGHGATGYTVNNGTQITATVPVTASSGTITVTTASGTATSSGTFTVPPPTITGFTPTSGGAGTSVVITGTGFLGASAVAFNGHAATIYTVNSGTQITATVPVGANSGTITVTTVAGTGTSSGTFTVPPPTITGFTPASGAAGTSVVITGTGFLGASAVTFNGRGATGYTVNSATQITTTVPPLAGSGKIAVTTASGTGQSSANFAFVYTPVTFTVTNTNASGGGSLRQAIIDANTAGPNTLDTIAFNIPGPPPFVIHPSTPLPSITDRVIIDGTTQPGYTSAPVVVLDADFYTSGGGLVIRAGNSTVRGLAIGRFGGAGILLETNGGNTITGCYVGIQSSGSTFPNARGIDVHSDTNVIGGTTAASRNVIASNYFAGITVTSASTNYIRGNYIGTAPSGLAAASNQFGIVLENASATTIGGTAAGARNIIAGNLGGNVVVRGAGSIGTTIQGNFIGTDATGTASLGCIDGVRIEEYANGATIGATAAGAANVIAFCHSGIAVPLGTRASARGNSMFENWIAIDLGSNGPTANDSGDIDGGPNGLQNFPVITSASISGGSIAVAGTLSSLPNATYTVDFYADRNCPAGTRAIPRDYVGSTTASTNSAGTASFSASFPTALTLTQVQTLTAIATDSLGNSSEGADAVIVSKAAPTITSFTPTSGAIGSSVTINGTGFTCGNGVGFVGASALVYAVESDTRVVASVPDNAMTGPIQIRTPHGNVTSAGTFTVSSGAPPTITGFTPASGLPATSVNVTGTNLLALESVRFNGVSAAFYQGTATSFTAIVPSGATTGPISVTTAAGSGASLSNFTIPAPPTITSFTPASGVIGSIVTINGTGFNTVTQLVVGGSTASYSIISGTQITATIPFTTSGPITVYGPTGSATSASSFTILPPPAPNITGFTPTSGLPGTQVTITGTGFLTGGRVYFNGIFANPSVVDATHLQALVPTGATTGPIRVETISGAATSATNFTVPVWPAPTISSFSPTSGGPFTVITINGTNFLPQAPSTTVTLNGQPVSIAYAINDTNYSVTLGQTASSGRLVITTPGGTATSASDFTFVPPPPPTITSFTPTSGKFRTYVTITGTNFDSLQSVQFNGVSSALGIGINSSTEAYGYFPAAATTGPITIATYGGSVTSATNFTRVIGLPTISGFTPTSGLPGTSVAISGTNLLSATEVRFNGVSAMIGGMPTDASVTVNAPAGATTGPITVINTDGSIASSSNFTVNVIGAPTISGFSPTSAYLGAAVVIAGTNFVDVAAVRFGTTPVSYLTNSATQITAYVPSGFTNGPITVVTTHGSATSASNFTRTLSPPSISGFSPTSGTMGTRVIISGSNFRGINSVTIGGVWASSTIDAPNQITATVPYGAVTGPIAVNGLDGTATSATNFTVNRPAASPAISSFTPTSGGDGTVVTINGTNLTGTMSVAFNGYPAANVQVVNSTQVRATVAEGSTTGKITLQTTVELARSASDFTVTAVAPVISSFSPASGPVGTVVLINGQHLLSATDVRFNGVPSDSFGTDVLNSPEQFQATVPLGATTGRITVTNAGGTGTSSTNFTVTSAGSPAISGFTPLTGSSATVVTIYGSFLSGATAVRFNGVNASTFTAVGATQITATVPPNATSGPISIVIPSGTLTSAASFSILPSITSVSPTSGFAGATVTINGTNLIDATSVRFNGVSSPFSAVSSTQITTTVPAAGTTGTITVSNDAGTGSSPSPFTVLVVPTISGFTPASGGIGDVVTINGSGFVAGLQVSFNGVPAGYSPISSTQITAVVPAGATTGPISITTSGGTAVSGISFTVLPSPTITTFSPTSGSPGVPVVINGTNFSGATAVRFGGAAATYTVDSSIRITATVPALGLTGPITVTTGGGTATSNANFIVNSRHGDANNDGTVDVSDLVMLINRLFGGGTAPAGNADANGDGVVNVLDVFYLVNYFFAAGPAPPA